MKTTATAVPVVKDPHPEPVRAAIRDLIRDYAPVELRDLHVVQIEPDWYQVNAYLGACGHFVFREVTL